MSDELLPQAGNDAADEQASSAKEESELKRARDDAAKYRTKMRDLEAQLKELSPLAEQFKASQEAQKSEAQKAMERVAEAERKTAESIATAERAQKELAVTRLATQAGVDLALVPYLDLSKLDLTDEKAALEVLGKLATARTTANGASNPARNGATGMTDKELRDTYFNGGGPRSKTMIFGGN